MKYHYIFYLFIYLSTQQQLLLSIKTITILYLQNVRNLMGELLTARRHDDVSYLSYLQPYRSYLHIRDCNHICYSGIGHVFSFLQNYYFHEEMK